MSKPNQLLIHALAIHTEKPGTVHARATVRLGVPSPGDRVRFEGTDRVMRELKIVDIKQSNRLSTLGLIGSEEDLRHLVGGTYLYGAED
ncbi:MAG: hypothetical protein MUO51_03550 [Woeseiaceae bacterium]|nr:hypothetical protein [Woeseiaceae bacterium]